MPLNYSQYRAKAFKNVSMLPVLSKMYEKVALEKVIKFIEKKLIYHQYQFGYRKNHSATTLFTKLLNETRNETY